MKLDSDFYIDSSQTLESLEGKMQHYDIPTSLMGRISKLAKTPLASIDDEGLRLLLVQRMFSKSVIPATIVLLSRDPFAGGDLEYGALIRSLFQFTPLDFWRKNEACFEKAKAVLIAANQQLVRDLHTEIDPEKLSILLEAKENLDQANDFILRIDFSS
jgi:hypothetical protein